MSTAWLSELNKVAAVAIRPAVYVCPSDTSEAISKTYLLPSVEAATGSYALVAGTNGASFAGGMESKYFNDGMFHYVEFFKLREVREQSCAFLEDSPPT